MIPRSALLGALALLFGALLMPAWSGGSDLRATAGSAAASEDRGRGDAGDGATAQIAADDPVQVDLTRWDYRADPHDVGERRRWQREGAGAGWGQVTVPHVFDPRPIESRFGGSIGWYRLRFRMTEEQLATRPELHLETVRRTAKIWLNGELAGRVPRPYVPADIPLENLRAGDNEIVIRVDSRRPEKVREGWWTWGGLTRPVELVPRGDATLRETGLVPRRRGGRWELLLDGMLENRTDQPLSPVVRVAVAGPDGRLYGVETAPVPLAARGSRRIRQTIDLGTDPALWSPSDPRLHAARIDTVLDNVVQTRQELKIGVRHVRVSRTGGLLINDVPIQLRGASLQEDMPGSGAALTKADIDTTVADLKAIGANVTRAHYVLPERMLQQLDAAGILVWNGSGLSQPDRYLEDRAGYAVARRLVRESVIAARNHPSVVVHSILNEADPKVDSRPRTAAFYREAAALTRRLDPSVPVAADLLGYPNYPRQRTYDVIDVLGVNSYFGWYKGRPGKYSTKRFRTIRPYLRAMERKYRGKALVISEFGAEATFSGPRSRKETYAFQADYVRRTLAVVDRLRFVDGAIYWTLREFAVKPDWDGGAERSVPRDGIHNKGLLEYRTGRRKPAWATARAGFVRAR